MTIVATLIGGGSGGLSNPVTLAEGGTGQDLTAPAQTGTLEFFGGTAFIATASNSYRFYDDMDADDNEMYDIQSTGTGAQTITVAPLDDGHAGVIACETGTTSSGGASIARNGGSNIGPYLLGGGNYFFETCINIPTLAVDGGDDYIIAAGLQDGWAFGFASNGLYFQYQVDTSANWLTVSNNGGTFTETTSSTAVATGWTRLGILYTQSTATATYYVNGTSIATHTTNIPTVNPIGAAVVIIKTNGTDSRTVYVDYFDVMIVYTTPR
jgi:hypothetical protein